MQGTIQTSSDIFQIKELDGDHILKVCFYQRLPQISVEISNFLLQLIRQRINAYQHWIHSFQSANIGMILPKFPKDIWVYLITCKAVHMVHRSKNKTNMLLNTIQKRKTVPCAHTISLYTDCSDGPTNV